MSKKQEGSKAYFEFLGGQNSAAAPDNLSDNEAREILNMDVVVRGAVKTRYGTSVLPWACLTPLAQVVASPDRTAEFSTTLGVLVQLVLINGSLYRRDNTTALLTGCGIHMHHTVYNNKMYILIKNSYYVYDGTTLAEVTTIETDNNLATIKKCKYIQARAERIYCSGNPEAPNTLYFSQVGNPTYFKTGSFMVQAASSDGDVISGLKEFNEALLVFKSRGVWAWFGYSVVDDVRFVKLNIHNGTKAYRTIANVNNLLFYLGEDGVYAMKGTYSGSIDTVKVTMNIDDQFDKLYMPSNAWESTACAIYAGGVYYLSYCVTTGDVLQDKTINNRMAVCHAAAGLEANKLPWTVYQGVYAKDILDSVDGNVYFGHEARPLFYVFDESAYNDMGIQFTYKFKSKAYDVGSPIHTKKYIEAWLAINQSITDDTVLDALVKIDYASVTRDDVTAAESLVWGKGDWGVAKWGWIDTVTRVIKISRKGIRASIEITGSSDVIAKNRLFLYGLAFRYKIKRPYKEV